MIERGINVNMVDKSGRSALFYAVGTLVDTHIYDIDEMECNMIHASKEIVSELLKHGADLYIRAANGGCNVLSTFCRSGLFAIHYL